MTMSKLFIIPAGATSVLHIVVKRTKYTVSEGMRTKYIVSKPMLQP